MYIYQLGSLKSDGICLTADSLPEGDDAWLSFSAMI